MTTSTRSRRYWLPAVLLAASAAILPGPHASVSVTLDAASLNDLLGKMAPDQVRVTLGAGRAITLRLDDLRVTGFDPAAAGGRGHVLTALHLRVPELGLDVPVEPMLSLQFRDEDGRKTCYLRFERVLVELPLTGPLDVAPLLPTLPIVADTAWTVDTARGEVRVEPRLVDAALGSKNLRLGFELDVRPVVAPGP